MKRVGKLAQNDCVFLVCDVQGKQSTKLVTSNLERFRSLIYKFDHLLATSSALVAAARVLNIPCLVTEQNPSRLGKTCSEIDVKDLKVYEKQLFSMTTPEVLKELKRENKKSVVLFGLETHVCVFQSAIELIQRDYEVHIVVDAVSSQRQLDRNVALERLSSTGCFLTTFESALFTILGTAEHPQFKEISNIAKNYAKTVKDNSFHLSGL